MLVSETECKVHYNYLNKVLPEEKARPTNLAIDVGKINPPLSKLPWMEPVAFTSKALT